MAGGCFRSSSFVITALGNPISCGKCVLCLEYASSTKLSTVEEEKKRNRNHSLQAWMVARRFSNLQDFSKSWLHVDRNLRVTPDYLDSVQCAINLIQGNPSDNGGFVCIPQSHHEYAKMAKDPTNKVMQTWMKPKGHYLSIPHGHPLLQKYTNPKNGKVNN